MPSAVEIDSILDAAIAEKPVEDPTRSKVIDAMLDEALLSAPQPQPQLVQQPVPSQPVPSQAALQAPPQAPVSPEQGPGPLEALGKAFSGIVPTFREEVAGARERITSPEFSVIDRVMGAIDYGFSPFTAISKPFVGDPATSLLKQAGVPEPIAKFGGSISELFTPFLGVTKLSSLTKAERTFLAAAEASEKAAKTTAESVSKVLGTNTLDPSLNADAIARLKVQKESLSPWQKYIGPKFETVSDKIGGALKRVGMAENFSKQQQTVKQLKIKQDVFRSEITGRFGDLAIKVDTFPKEKKVLLEKAIAKPNVLTGDKDVDKLVADIHTAIKTSVGETRFKETPQQGLEFFESAMLVPGLLGTRGITHTIDRNSLNAFQKYGFKLVPDNIPGAKEVRVNRKFTEGELGQLTELDDIGNWVANIGKSLASDIPRFQFYDDIATQFAGQLLSEATPGYRKVSDKRIRGTSLFQKGTLAGKYIPEDLADDIEFFDSLSTQGKNHPAIQGYLKANSTWKLLNTAYDPSVVFNNYVSSAIAFTTLSQARKGTAISALKELKDEGPLFKIAKKMGVFQSGFATAEGLRGGKDVIDSFVSSVRKPSDLTTQGAISSGIKFTTDIAKKKALMTHNKIMDMYSMGDDIWRFATFIDRLEKGRSPTEAAIDARKLYVDYDINAPVISLLRNATHPFISYSYRMLPILTEAAVKQPVKFGALALLGYGLQATRTAEEDKTFALLPEREESTVLGIPGAPSTLVKVGKDKALDVSKVLPGGNIFENPEQGIPLVPQALQPSGGLAGEAFTTFVLGQNAFGDKILSPPTETGELAARAGEFLGKQLPDIPGVPGAPATNKLKQAISGNFTDFQTPQTTMQAALDSVGIRVINLDRDRNLRLQELKFKESLGMMKRRSAKLKSDLQRGFISQEDLTLGLQKIANEEILLRAEFRNKVR